MKVECVSRAAKGDPLVGGGFDLVKDFCRCCMESRGAESRLADKLARRGRKGERASERRETDEVLAERIAREALTKSRWREIDLATQPKRHPVKVAIAQQLRRQTPMSRQWIADRLRMGSASYVSNLLSSVDSKL
jgi:hypothetical protein